MRNLLYTVAVILLGCWAIGFIGYNIGGILHMLLVIAVIASYSILFRERGFFRCLDIEATQQLNNQETHRTNRKFVASPD